MLIEKRSFSDAEMEALMDIYSEGNRENVPFFFPELTDTDEGLRRVKESFADYIRNDFLTSPGNSYFVLEEGGRWVSALRLYALEDCYYIEALETEPGSRRKGYGSKLMGLVIEHLSRFGSFVLRDCVSKKNQASLATHKSCGFVIDTDPGKDYLDGSTNDRDYGMAYYG